MPLSELLVQILPEGEAVAQVKMKIRKFHPIYLKCLVVTGFRSTFTSCEQELVSLGHPLLPNLLGKRAGKFGVE